MAPHTSHAIPSRRRLAVASSLLFTVAALAQKPAPPQDPANLAGEHVSPQALADTLPINHGAPALAQLLKKLRTRASLMMIVAHPDDEDSGMLTYESRGQGARVAMLTLTRGEGGQNLMSADFNDALGLIRTQELLAEDRYTGTDQFFGSVVDFGFSKTREETLDQWTHDRVLYDAVRAVRLYRPLILTSVFIGGVTDGHGHHQVAGQMNQEVFAAAADPKVFPEMGLPAWAPLKVYARVPFARVSKEGMFDYATGKSSPPRFYNYVTKQWSTTPPAANVMVPEGNVSDAPGMDGQSYVQFAREGLTLQKTQIGNNVRIPRPGPSDTPYTRYASRIDAKDKEQSFFDGIDVTLPGIATLAPGATPILRAYLRENLGEIDRSLEGAQKAFTVEHPESTATALASALKTLDATIAQMEKFSPQLIPADQRFNVLHELRVKRVQANNALGLALGVSVEGSLEQASALSPNPTTSSTSIPVRVVVKNAGHASVTVESLGLAGGPHKAGTSSPLAPSGSHSAVIAMEYPSGAPATRPYFSRADLEQPFYNIADPVLRNAPETPAPLIATASLVFEGAKLELRAAALKPPQGARGEVQQAAVIVPAVSLGTTHAGIVPLNKHQFVFGTRIFAPQANGLMKTGSDLFPVKITAPTDWTVTHLDDRLSAAPRVGDRYTITPGPLESGKRYTLAASATVDGHTYNESYVPVGYSGITTTNYFQPAVTRITAVDVVTAPGLTIGYLPGTGDQVVDFIQSLDLSVRSLTPADLTPKGLKGLDAVVLGVRAYAAHPELASAASLLDYAKAGGVVIVQYNTAKYGDGQSPYPIDVPGDSAHNVVVEAQPVQILTPDAPVLNWPNKITPADFKGWTEELGHGFAASWDPHFEALTETHDPDQDPQKGGLLYARTGRGAYVYVAYALYRQLPEGVPGAYRIFANLLSLPKNPKAGLQPVAP